MGPDLAKLWKKWWIQPFFEVEISLDMGGSFRPSATHSVKNQSSVPPTGIPPTAPPILGIKEATVSPIIGITSRCSPHVSLLMVWKSFITKANLELVTLNCNVKGSQNFSQSHEVYSLCVIADSSCVTKLSKQKLCFMDNCICLYHKFYRERGKSISEQMIAKIKNRIYYIFDCQYLQIKVCTTSLRNFR